jgi:hypothetical protein
LFGILESIILIILLLKVFFIYTNKSKNEKYTVFIGLAQFTKKPATDYYFLKDYYKRNEDYVK